jgi:hypothetical protein
MRTTSPRTSTSFGEETYAVDGFAAEPGTVSSYEEFRGTGGSLYFVRRRTSLPVPKACGSSCATKDSQAVTGVVNLRSAIDYDIDYLQGRILLSEPLSSNADDSLPCAAAA